MRTMVIELRVISLRKQNTFDNNSKQVEEKIKNKKRNTSKTIFFTEHRRKKVKKTL